MQESETQDKIRQCAHEHGARLFRNNVGSLQDARGRYVQYGLCVGSSDLIGWTEVEITPDMVGKRVAVFTAIEVKAPKGKPTEAQNAFIDAVLRSGGRAGVARSDADFVQIISRPPL